MSIRNDTKARTGFVEMATRSPFFLAAAATIIALAVVAYFAITA